MRVFHNFHSFPQEFSPPITPYYKYERINKLIELYLTVTKVKSYKQFEQFISKYCRFFNPRYIKSFKIVYLRDYLGFRWKEIALLVKKKRTTCIKRYKKLKENPSLLFKQSYPF